MSINEIDWESLSEDESLDKLTEIIESKPAQLTTDNMDELERAWKARMRARRMALVMLTMPFTELRDKVQEDKEFATAVAATLACTQNEIDFCRGVAESLETAQVWMNVSLCYRDDMQEILEAGKSQVEAA